MEGIAIIIIGVVWVVREVLWYKEKTMMLQISKAQSLPEYKMFTEPVKVDKKKKVDDNVVSISDL